MAKMVVVNDDIADDSRWHYSRRSIIMEAVFGSTLWGRRMLSDLLLNLPRLELFLAKHEVQDLQE